MYNIYVLFRSCYACCRTQIYAELPGDDGITAPPTTTAVAAAPGGGDGIASLLLAAGGPIAAGEAFAHCAC